MYRDYDLQLIHEDPNLVVSLVIKIFVRSYQIALGPQEKCLYL